MTALRTAARSTTALGSFAHLLGIPVAKRAENDEPRSPPEDDDSGAQRAEDEDGAKRAESDDREPCKECDGTGEDDEGEACDACDGTGKEPAEDDDARRARRAKKAETDEEAAEEQDEDEDVRKAAKAGRRFERARCKAIFAHPAAGVRPDMAAQLAFGTKLSAKQAISLLKESANVRGGHQHGPRAARPRVELVDGAPAPTGSKGMAARIVAAGKKRRGEKPTN
jgi:hypothetical protein